MTPYRTVRARTALVLLGIWAMAPAGLASEPPGRKGDPEKKICRRPVADIGSRIPPKADCRTEAEWAEEARLNQAAWQARKQAPATPRQ